MSNKHCRNITITLPEVLLSIYEKSIGQTPAANYSGQFQCYQKALEANGETVIARLVYYPVGGLVVELK